MAGLKDAIRELAEFVEENEPRLISYSVSRSGPATQRKRSRLDPGPAT